MLRGVFFKAATLIIIMIVMVGAKCNKDVVATPSTIVVPSPGYETIQKAINAANSGEVIRVTRGIYYENLIVNKSVSIIGEDPATTIIDGGGLGNVVTITSPNVVVSGFTIQNGTQGDWPYCGISIFRCNFAVVNNTVLRNNYYGLQLIMSNNSRIFNNLLVNNSYAGMYIHDGSSNNVFFENTIRDNLIGLWVTGAPSNTFYHNNIIDNVNQLWIDSPATWDNGVEGNFWSDYAGVDLHSGPYQNETGSDGIGDSQYSIAGDRYPLMSIFTNFTFTYKSQIYFLSTICNSTILNFQFDETNKKISFNVTGPNGTIGFCRTAMPVNHTVLVDDHAPSYFRNWTFSRNTYTYFTYEHTNVLLEVTVTLELSEGTTPPSSTNTLIVIAIIVVVAVVVSTIIVLRMRKKEKSG